MLNPRKIIFFNANLPKNPASPRSGVASQDTTGTNGSPIKTGALVDPWGDTYLVYIDGSYDGLTTSWIAYSDLTYSRDSANNKCVPGAYLQNVTEKTENRGKMAMENIRRRTMSYPGNDSACCQSAIRNLKSEILPMRV